MKHADEDIEKVARAICRGCGDDPDAWCLYKPDAIAALDAMFAPRQPRECWVVFDRAGEAFRATDDADSAKYQAATIGSTAVHMREVME